MVWVLHKELEYKVEKLKHKKVKVMQLRIKCSRDWFTQSIIYYWRIIAGRGGGLFEKEAYKKIYGIEIKSVRIIDILWALLTKQLFHKRLLDMRWL